MTTEYQRIIKDAKWVLLWGYAFLTIFALVQFVRMWIKNERRKSSKPKWLYFSVFLFSLSRTILDAIPIKVYVTKIQIHSDLQVCLDLLPELLAFSTYFLLLLIWAELYHFSKKMRNSSMISKRLWITFLIVNVIVYSTGVGIAFGLRHETFSLHHIKAEAILLAILSLSFAVVYPIYAFLLFRVIEKASISSNRKEIIVKKLTRLLIVCILCFVVHSLYILLLNFRFRKESRNSEYNALFWLLYFIVTEQLPIFLILLFTSSITSQKGKKSKLDNMDRRPLLSNQGGSGVDSSEEGQNI